MGCIVQVAVMCAKLSCCSACNRHCKHSNARTQTEIITQFNDEVKRWKYVNTGHARSY